MSESNLMGARLRAQLGKGEGLKELDKVVEKYGRVEGEPFSFVGHEFQRGIIRDTRSRIYVRKCSQVGLSELMVQKILALNAVLQHKRLIFTLPVAAMAAKFSKDRIDGAIEQSDYYRGMVVKANNSASQKKIGSNTLYIGGTYGDTGAISVPAYAVISDEIDFSNQVVLGKLSSRLRHAPKDEMGIPGMRFEFSTPTVDDYGIDERFKRGHQAYYMVKCSNCSTWTVPDYFEDFVIPGFDKPLIELERRDLENTMYRFQDTWIKCSCCGADLERDLLRPDRREWVAKKPDRWEHSYQVYPWDLPTYNSPSSIIQQFSEYKREEDFYNFCIGISFSSPDNSFLVNEEHKTRMGDAELWIYEHCIVKSATVGGLDVGKTCHLVVSVKAGSHTYIVWAEAIPNTITHPATEAVLQRFEFFKMIKLVVDAGPDITLVNQLIAAKGLGQISACQYTRSIPGLDIISEHDDGQLIKADRSKTMGDLMKQHNAGFIHYPKSLVDDIFPHLKAIKKIRRPDSTGDMVESFEATGEDHYGHAMNYMNIARIYLDDFGADTGPSMPPMVGRLQLGRKSKSKEKSFKRVI